MFRDVVLQDTRPEEWPALRERIRQRVAGCMGTPPQVKVAPEMQVVKEYENYGLKHLLVRFRVLPDEYGLAVMVMPEGVNAQRPAPAVVVCHGTARAEGKYSVLTREAKDFRGYAIDLAQRGFVAVAPDTYIFGELLTRGEDLPYPEIEKRWNEANAQFAKAHPEWSLDGRRLWDHQRLLDLLDTLDFVQPKRYGVIGNSLGGRTTIFLTAFDERIGAGVPSTGVSPNVTNIYRSGAQRTSKWADYVRNSGLHYEYQDIIALAAPRPLLIIEPFNDPYNPFLAANFQVYLSGQRAYGLLGKPECFCTLNHGDGHGIPPDACEFAYRWFERWLTREAAAAPAAKQAGG
jgi:dienelactone hydrolase